MRKLLWMCALCVFCGLVVISTLAGVEKVWAKSRDLQPVQVQNSGFTDSQGTISVSAACPQNYQIQTGNAQISASNQGQTPTYAIHSNGPNTQKNTWVTTIENKVAESLSITITATCVQKAGA